MSFLSLSNRLSYSSTLAERNQPLLTKYKLYEQLHIFNSHSLEMVQQSLVQAWQSPSYVDDVFKLQKYGKESDNSLDQGYLLDYHFR